MSCRSADHGIFRLGFINMIGHKATQKLIWLRLKWIQPRQRTSGPLIPMTGSALNCTFATSCASPCRELTKQHQQNTPRIMEIDTESQNSSTAPLRDTKRKHHFIRAGRIPLPISKTHIIIDVLKIALCLTAAA